MEFWGVVIASVVLVFLWGLISPRSQWKVLLAWSYRKPEANEPSALAFGVQRAISALGILFFIVVGAVAFAEYLDSLPPPAPPLSDIQQMWGVAPAPVILDRVVKPNAKTPTEFVEVPVEGFQVVDNESREPRYLYLLDRFNSSGARDAGGLVGSAPGTGFTALNSAELVIGVRTWSECIPRTIVVKETETSVQIGVFVGLPLRADDAPVDHLRCDRPAFVQNSLLIPIDLAAELGDREVQTLESSPLAVIHVADN